MKHWVWLLFIMIVLKAEGLEDFPSKPEYFTLTRFKDRNFSETLKQNKDKLIMIHVWGSWCGPCVKELPDLLRLAQILQKELVVFIVAYQTSKEDQKDFLNRIFTEYGEPSSNVIFVEDSTWDMWDIHYIPVSYLFDWNNNFILEAAGRKSWLGTKGNFVPNWWPFAETWEEFLVECYVESENCPRRKSRMIRDLSSLNPLFSQFVD